MLAVMDTFTTMAEDITGAVRRVEVRIDQMLSDGAEGMRVVKEFLVDGSHVSKSKFKELFPALLSAE
jgi:hypothetical protein